METAEMGRVLTPIAVENLEDLWAVRRGDLPADKVRRVEVTDALVDTGASLLALPTSLIKTLGLKKGYERPARAATGTTTVAVYDVVRLAVQGRECKVEVMEVPDGTPALVGQLPLEMMSFVVDMTNHRLTGDPTTGGEHVLDLFLLPGGNCPPRRLRLPSSEPMTHNTTLIRFTDPPIEPDDPPPVQ
ncbi:MAG: retroviral-like aspartic protease family protein [Gemmataceae bacterium]|nr:retroviral-like aspartic protease family protein [Gemmataceae bacterium]